MRAERAGARCSEATQLSFKSGYDAGSANSRARLAVQAELAKLRPVAPVVPIAAEKLRREREAAAARGGRGQDGGQSRDGRAHTWQLYLEEQEIELESYPSVETVVEFAVSASLARVISLL